MPKVVRLSPPTGERPYDPLDVNTRLYRQISQLLTELEQQDVYQRVTLRERIAAIIAIGRIQTIFVGLRKENPGVGSGSTVRKYQAAFNKNDASSRKKIAGPKPAAEPEPEPDWFEQAGLADDDDRDDLA